jgi:hypothetical protein
MDAQFDQPHRASADASLEGNGCLRQSVILGFGLLFATIIYFFFFDNG